MILLNGELYDRNSFAEFVLELPEIADVIDPFIESTCALGAIVWSGTFSSEYRRQDDQQFERRLR